MSIQGSSNQIHRLATYGDFCSKKRAVLFTTDVSARGLDFPGVDWVVQVDCPDDVDTYIHRVGRTARYNAGGRALLFLLPSERNFVDLLKIKKIDIQEIEPKKNRLLNVDASIRSMVAEDAQLKFLAQKAVVSYIRSIFLQVSCSC